MRVERLQAIPYSLPFREPYVTARGRLDERELLALRLEADGLVGWGETAALSLRGGAPVGELARQLAEVCLPALQEVPLDPERIWSALARCRARGATAPALAALDIALHDLAGRAAGQPVWRLLGAGVAAPVVCNATLPAGNPARLRELAQRWAGQGFRTFKLKVGVPGDVAQVAAMRELLGPEARLRVDVNGAWSMDEAVERLRAMGRHTLELAEEPVSGIAQLAKLRARVRIPIAADESVASAREAREAAAAGACSLATVKLAKVGGISEALQVASALPVYLSSALEGPIGITAAAHAVQALPDRAASRSIAHGLATERLFSVTVGAGARLRGDLLELPDGAGLGVEVDEDALAARALR